MSDMENLSRTNRPATWKWAEGGQAETIANKSRDLTRGYLHQPSELFADSTAQFMMHPDVVKADAPAFAAFLKKLVNNDKLISQVIAFAGLSSVVLPGITDLVNDVNPEFIGEPDGG